MPTRTFLHTMQVLLRTDGVTHRSPLPILDLVQLDRTRTPMIFRTKADESGHLTRAEALYTLQGSADVGSGQFLAFVQSDTKSFSCLLYTSDAADDLLCV